MGHKSTLKMISMETFLTKYQEVKLLFHHAASLESTQFNDISFTVVEFNTIRSQDTKW